jgi:hypothetical protein
MPRDLLEHTFDLIAGDYSDGSSSSDEGRPEMAEVEIMTDPPNRIFICFGEVFVRLEQRGEMFSRTICGMEFGVEFARLGNHVEFFSVLPEGVIGDEIVKQGTDQGIEMRAVRSADGFPVGDVYVFEDGRAGIQRSQSSFVNHIGEIKWKDGIIADKTPCWVHSACSSFTWSERTGEQWATFMETACDPLRNRDEVFVIVEFDTANSRVAMSGLWKMVEPFVSRISVLVLTPGELVDLMKVVGMEENLGENSDGWNYQMRSLSKVVDCTCIVLAFSSENMGSLAVFHKIHGFVQSKPEEVDIKTLLAKFIHSWNISGSIENSYHFQQLVSGSSRPAQSYKLSRKSMVPGASKSQRIDV